MRSLLLVLSMGLAPSIPTWATGTLPPCNKALDPSSWTSCHGTVTWPNGQTFVGEFVNGTYHGLGVLTYRDGRAPREGIWDRGIFVRSEYIANYIVGRASQVNAQHQSPVNPLAAGVEAAKGKCRELGFKPSTEKFGDCVLRLTR